MNNHPRSLTIAAVLAASCVAGLAQGRPDIRSRTGAHAVGLSNVANPPARIGHAAQAGRITAASYGRLPLTFEKNTGRYDKRVRFMARTGGGALFITDREAVLSVGPPRGSHRMASVLRMRLVGSHGAAAAAGLDRQPGIVNYFMGSDPAKWRTSVPTFGRVKLAGVYPGVDLVYYGVKPEQGSRAGALGRLEYDFVVRPGADVRRIAMAFDGAKSLKIAPNGDLVASTDGGDVRLKRPFAYQMVSGHSVQIACAFILAPRRPALQARAVTLRLARHDPARAVIIDPVIEYATYLGGDSYDSAAAIAVDAAGATYVAGTTTASSGFPTTPGAYRTVASSCLFVSKLDPTGNYLVYSTFVGGASDDTATAIMVDSSGAAYVAGKCKGAVPTTPGAFQTSVRGGFDGFVLKLTPSGSALVYSTLIGGSKDDAVYALVVDPGGAAYVAGQTASSGFPTTPGAFQTTFSGTAAKAFVAKLGPAGSNLEYSTFLGASSGATSAYAIAVDGAGSAYAAGATQAETFPITLGAFQSGYLTPGCAFVTKFSPAGTSLVYSTYLGGYGNIYGYDGNCARAIAVDASGSAYVTGYTDSRTFPTTVDAFQTHSGGGIRDVFVTKMNPAGSALEYSTYLGGSGSTGMGGPVEAGLAIHVDDTGAAYVAGYTESLDFPVTPDGYQTASFGGADAFITKVSPSGSALVYSTYLGGSGSDSACATAVHADGAMYVAGTTWSDDFPSTPGAYQGGLRGRTDAFVAKLGTRTWTGTTLVVPPASGTVGQAANLQAVLAVSETGVPLLGMVVQFQVAGTPVGSAETNAAGVATVSYSVPAGLGGCAVIRASCAGDSIYHSAAGTGILAIAKADTTLVADDATGAAGSVAALSAVLARSSDFAPLYKTITFTDNGTRVGYARSSTGGRATLSYKIPGTASLGLHTIGAAFAGDADYNASSGSAILNVTTGTTMFVVDRTGNGTEFVTLKGWLRRSDTSAFLAGKLLTFSVDGTDVASGVTDSGGQAAVTWRIAGWVVPGSHALTCGFAGDSTFAPSSAGAALTVTQTATKMYMPDRAGRPYQVGSRAYLTAYLYRMDNSPVGNKTLQFQVDGTTVGSGVTNDPEVGGNGRAMYLWDIPVTFAAGAHAMRADFAGDNGYTASHTLASLTLDMGALYIWPYVRSVVQGEAWPLRALVRTVPDYTWQPGLTIEFTLDPGPSQVSLGTAVTDAAGVATLQASSAGIAVGQHTIRASYAGSPAVAPAQADTTATVVAP